MTATSTTDARSAVGQGTAEHRGRRPRAGTRPEDRGGPASAPLGTLRNAGGVLA